MANTGYKWAAWAYLKIGATDCDGTSGAATDDWDNDEANTIDAVDLDLKAACEISMELTLSTGTPSADGVNLKILRDVDGTDYESPTLDGPWSKAWTDPDTQSTTFRKTFNVPMPISGFKFWVENKTDIDNCSLVLRYRIADIPVAS